MGTIRKRTSFRLIRIFVEKMIKGSFYILLFYFIGESISALIHGFLPGSVIGMVLLFLSLFFKILNPENVKATATTITKNMAVFFIPAAVGLMAYGELVSRNFLAIALGISVSTILTIITVALIQENMGKRGKKGENPEAPEDVINSKKNDNNL